MEKPKFDFWKWYMSSIGDPLTNLYKSILQTFYPKLPDSVKGWINITVFLTLLFLLFIAYRYITDPGGLKRDSKIIGGY